MSQKKNVFVFGLDEFNRGMVENLHGAEDIEFHSLLSPEDVLERTRYPMEKLIQKARRELKQFKGSVDGILHHYDFPVSTMAPVLCEDYGLPHASLTSVLKCEHKYWSRIEQEKSIPECIPEFCAFDPYHEDPISQIPIEYPFWIKPIKSFSSYLGFRINNEEEFNAAIKIIRANIKRFKGSFDYMVDMVRSPKEVHEATGTHCMAESIIGGRQCTLECYVRNGKPVVYGVVDSIRLSNKSSFFRYQYPSKLPKPIQARMKRAARKFLSQIKYNNAPCNIEFFWDKRNDKIWFLEINPRISQSHCGLFERVHGVSHHQVALDLQLRHEPRIKRKGGPFNYSAKFFVRRHKDAIVRRVPTKEEIAKVEKKIPGTYVIVNVEKDMKLSDLADQDSYTYNPCIIYIGAKTQKMLLEKYRRAKAMLPFKFVKIKEPKSGKKAA